MVEQNGLAGSNGTNISGINGAKLFNDAGRAWREAQGATPLSPFEFVPPLGFREYWYPALFKKEVGPKKPIFVSGEGPRFIRLVSTPKRTPVPGRISVPRYHYL